MFSRWRRLHIEVLGIAACATAVAACSVHPLPEDFSRASTVDIVKSIRCEALAGIERLKPHERSQAEPIIRATTIGYDFTFTLDEANGAGGVDDPQGRFVRFQRAFVPKTSTLDLRAKANLSRQNARTFTIIEPLADVTKKENSDICKDRTKRASWTYPVAGAVGLDEIVRTYLKLEMLTELKQIKGPHSAPSVGKFPLVFSDQLVFTTHFEAGANGTLVLPAVVGRLSITNASVGANASRNDRHSVIVALTRENVDVDEAVRSGKATSARARMEAAARRERATLVRDVRDPRSQARLIQIDAPASDAVAIELQQRRARNDEDSEAARALGQRLLDLLKVP